MLIALFVYPGYLTQVGVPPGAGPGPTWTTTTTTTPAPYDAAALKFALQNAITDGSISAGNEGLDISYVTGGVWDPMSKAETVADWSASTATSALTYNYGDTLVLHVYSDNDETGGTDCYDEWYYTTLAPGEPVRKLRPALLTPTQTSPTYKYSITGTGEATGFNIQYIAGTTPYWGLGVLKVMPRTTAANLDAYFVYGGTTMASLADGSTWVDTDGEITANATLATTNEKVYLRLVAGATNIAYGVPMYTISSIGRFETRATVCIFSTAHTGIGVTALTDKGWAPVADSTLTTEKAFYKVVGPFIPTKGNKFQVDIEIPLDTSAIASSTEGLYRLWLIDFQNEDNIRIGACSTSIPTAYGMVGAYGIDAMIYARAYTTSSGAGSSEVLRAYLTTA